jgi:hypothetical protein
VDPLTDIVGLLFVAGMVAFGWLGARVLVRLVRGDFVTFDLRSDRDTRP